MPEPVFQLDSVPKTESGAIDLSQAQRIAEGGTHVLYRFKDSPFVIKWMKQSPNAKEIEALEAQYAKLYESFDKDGKKRCIREQHIAYPVLLPNKQQAQDAVLSIVPYENCFQAKVKFDFKIEPTELDPYLMESKQILVNEANQALIHPSESKSDFDLNDYCLLDKNIGAILQRLDTDPQLRQLMTEFLNHYRDFYRSTNCILDAVGFENILFYKDENQNWQFKIGSVIKHDTGHYTNVLFHALGDGKEVDLRDFFNFTHAYFSPGNIRAVNACAMKLGLEPVIFDVQIDSKQLFKISQELSIPERMLAYARHGDFEKMDKLLQENKDQLNFNPRNFWAYSMIADEYLNHGKTPPTFKHYLDTVANFPVEIADKKEEGLAREDLKTNILDRKKMHERKTMLHQELAGFFPNSKFAFWSTTKHKQADSDAKSTAKPTL